MSSWGNQDNANGAPVFITDLATGTTGTAQHANTVFGISVAEQGVSSANTAHAGWNIMGERYTDANGNARQKTEVLVAMSSITGDGDDLPNS